MPRERGLLPEESDRASRPRVGRRRVAQLLVDQWEQVGGGGRISSGRPIKQESHASHSRENTALWPDRCNRASIP